MTKTDVKTKIIALKPHIDSDTADEMIDNRKVKLFQTLLKKPKKNDIHLHSLNLFYEAYLLLSATYLADFIRDAKHTIHVDKNVKEIIIEKQIYPVSRKKSVLSKLEPVWKNKVKIDLQERLMIKNYDDIAFGVHFSIKEWTLIYGNLKHSNSALGDPISIELRKYLLSDIHNGDFILAKCSNNTIVNKFVKQIKKMRINKL